MYLKAKTWAAFLQCCLEELNSFPSSLQLSYCELLLSEGFFFPFFSFIVILLSEVAVYTEIVFKINSVGLNEPLSFDIEANRLLFGF